MRLLATLIPSLFIHRSIHGTLWCREPIQIQPRRWGIIPGLAMINCREEKGGCFMLITYLNIIICSIISPVLSEECTVLKLYEDRNPGLRTLGSEAPVEASARLLYCREWCLQKDGCHAIFWSPSHCQEVTACVSTTGVPTGQIYFTGGHRSLPGEWGNDDSTQGVNIHDNSRQTKF